MDIKSIESKFLESMVDRIDSVSGLTYNNVFLSCSGIDDVNSYNLALFNINEKFKNRSDFLVIENGLDVSTDFNAIEQVKKDYEIVERSGFVASNIKLVNDISFNTTVLKNLDKLFNVIDSEIKFSRANFAVKFMLWVKDYLRDVKPTNTEIPKCLYYGSIKKHECYFLMFLSMCGFDILYLCPNDSSKIKPILNYKKDVELIELPLINEQISLKDRISKGEEISRSSINRASTVTAIAQERISNELFNETGMVVDSSQLEDRKIRPIILNTTFEEISIYYNQPLNFRPHYNLVGDTIEAPMFFLKVIGVHDDDKEYCRFATNLRKNENTLFLEFNGDESILKAKEFTRDDFRLTYLINQDNTFDRKAIIDNNDFEISILDKKLQNKILDALEEVFVSSMFVDKIKNNEKVQMLHMALNLDRKVLLHIEKFALGKVNPKLILYTNNRISMSREFVSMLLLLNKLGLDILLLTPSGSKDIEKVINDNIITVHRLPRIVDNFALSEIEQLKNEGKNILGKIFDIFKK